MAVAFISIDQIQLNAIRATFDGDVLQFDVNGLRDALNVDRWSLAGSTPGIPALLSVGRGTDATNVVVYLDAAIPQDALVSLTCNSLQGVEDPPENIPDATWTLFACGPEAPAGRGPATFSRVDIANPQTESDANGQALGTFPVTDSGDLGNVQGRAALRKRIMRRLTTRPDGFYHLVNYGLRVDDKALLTSSKLRQVQMDAEGQVNQEPGVLSCRATVRQVDPGIVHLKLKVVDDNGSFELDRSLDFTGETDG